MSTIKIVHEKDKPYTCLIVEAIRDNALSFGARGLHHYLLSFPDNWEINVSHLQSLTEESKGRIKSYIKELEALGYLRREQTRNSKNQFGSNTYFLYEFPMTSKAELS